MTLIACLHPHQCRTLIADSLITSPNAPDDDMALPMRTYIPPDQIRQMAAKPVGLCRKVIEINSNLVALWAGNYHEACLFARRAMTWFRGEINSNDDLLAFLDAHYRQRVPNFYAIVATANQDFYKIGDMYQSTSSFAGVYAVAGSGNQLFRKMMEEMIPREDDTVAPDIDGLQIANDFMAREVVTGEPIHAKFGGAYEVLYRGLKWFERVDDVVHIFALAKVLPTSIEISHYSHATRQWYEGEQLCVASFSTPQAYQQGMEFKVFEIPSVLGQETPSTRTLASLALRPNYMCIHHIFEIEDKSFPSGMILRGEAIDLMFKLSHVGDKLVFEATDAYRTLVQEKAARIFRGSTPHN
jgi:hypothetical protein